MKSISTAPLAKTSSIRLRPEVDPELKRMSDTVDEHNESVTEGESNVARCRTELATALSGGDPEAIAQAKSKLFAAELTALSNLRFSAVLMYACGQPAAAEGIKHALLGNAGLAKIHGREPSADEIAEAAFGDSISRQFRDMEAAVHSTIPGAEDLSIKYYQPAFSLAQLQALEKARLG